METTTRLRLVFEDPNILSKSQKKQGLNRSWFLLKPQQHQTIFQLSSHLLHVFDLQKSCPRGLILSMDGFVLPPFEITCILKDKDIISVKKRGKSTEIIKETGSLEDLGIVKRLPVNTGFKFLTNEEFDKEIGGYESDSEEDERELVSLENQEQVKSIPIENVASKKRKARNKPPSSRKKKSKLTTDEKSPGSGGERIDVRSKKRKNSSKQKDVYEDKVVEKEKPVDIQGEPENSNGPETDESSDNETNLGRKKKSKLTTNEKSPGSGGEGIDVRQKKRKNSCKQKDVAKDKVVEKEKPVDIQGEPENSNGPEIDESSDDGTNLGRSSQLQNTGKGSDDEPTKTTEANKLPSRSARRKKAKRRWLREQAKIEKEKLHEKDDQQSPAKENIKYSEERPQPDSNNDVGDNVIPIVVRPGHIRFEPLDEEDAEQAVQQSQNQVKTFQWNGITSKKKGQKWGMEKTPFQKRNENSFSQCMEETPFQKRNDNSFSQVSSEMVDVDEKATVTDDIDFDKLMPYSILPKEGDLVAYRLVELSSTWTPELSSFRVGKVSHYDAESNRIMLTPVPGYPNGSEKEPDEEASESELPDTSLYKEDGSLEIDYPSLIDVRLVKHGKSNTAVAIANGSNEKCAQDQDVLTREPNGNKEAAAVSATPPPQANGGVNVWEEISEALSAKKAELSKEDGWSKSDSSGRNAWSYRALRRSALGPTMSFLRAQNGI